MKLEETGWNILNEGTKWERGESKMVLLEEPRPMDELLYKMLANSCGGFYYRVKDGMVYSQELDDKNYNSHEWREEWEAKG